MSDKIVSDDKSMTDKEALLNEIDEFVGLRFGLMLFPIQKFLYKISEKQLWKAIYNLTSEVRLNIETILAKYNISAAESGDSKSNKTSISIGDYVEELEISVLKPKLIKVIGKGKNGQEIIRHLKITDKGKLLLI